MDLLGWLNILGEKADHYLNSDIRAAKHLALRNPTLQKINGLVDAYRGLLTIGFYLYMLGTLYLILWYDDSIMIKDARFTAVVDFCAKNASAPGGAITSQYTQTTCINVSLYSSNTMLKDTCHCIIPTAWQGCNCSSNISGR